MSGPSLFDAAAERAALASGRPKSQELAEIRHGVVAAELPAPCPVHGTPLLLEHGGGYSCPRCA